MPIIRQKMIYRADLQANPEVLYLFGDNDRREGFGGQAAEMRDEDNAVGIRTKWAPHMRQTAFFSDDDYDQIEGMINADLEPVREHLEKGGVVIIPTDGLGTGLSKLPEMAPAVAAYLTDQLNELDEV